MNILETRPVLTSATITSLVTAILVLLVSFGLPVTDEQRNAIIGVVAIVAPFAVIWWAQRKTTPLVDPTDADGEALTRHDGTPSIAAQKATGFPEVDR